MNYNPNLSYQVDIGLADESKDSFTLKGSDVIKLREKIFLHGYTRVDKKNKAITRWISPFLIATVTVTEKPK